MTLRNEHMSVIFERSPEEALEETFKRHAERVTYVKDAAFLYTSQEGLDGVRYGSFRCVRKTDLEGRQYRLEFWDGRVSLFFTDVYHHPRLHRNIPKELVCP